MIGIDWLKSNNVCWDFANGEAVIAGETHRLVAEDEVELVSQGHFDRRHNCSTMLTTGCTKINSLQWTTCQWR